MDGRKILRNFGWVCKGHCNPTKKKAGFPLYECSKNRLHEYCYDCASEFNWICPRDGGGIFGG